MHLAASYMVTNSSNSRADAVQGMCKLAEQHRHQDFAFHPITYVLGVAKPWEQST
jgi:hypothetical protein